MRSDAERLRDVLEAIERIEKYRARGREAFDGDELIQNWMLHHLQIIGEAVRAISADLKERNPAIPWSKIVGMRNILVHDYFGIDLEIVWNAVDTDLQSFKKEIERLIPEIS